MWAISSIVIVFIFTWGQVKLYAAELDVVGVENPADTQYVLYGALSWRDGDAGKIFKNDELPLREATYPTAWISKVKNNRVYFSNKAHQCALIISNTVPPPGTYELVGEKTFTTDKGDIKLNIFKNENAASDQKYLVLPTSNELKKIKGNNVFGLIRVDDPQLCADTFGKILSTAKFAEKK